MREALTKARGSLMGVTVALLLAACASPPVAPMVPMIAAPSPAPVAPPAKPEPPSLSILLRPVREPTPLVHVVLDLVAPPSADLHTWKLYADSLDPPALANLAARDATGSIAVTSHAAGMGEVDLALSRAPEGLVHLEYDVLAENDPADAFASDPRRLRVRGGHMRAPGAILALPPSLEAVRLPVSVAMDRTALEADKAASSLGVGSTQKTDMRVGALSNAVFLAGLQGDVVFDTLEGHDEAAWSGFASFDLRGAVVELAELRSAFATILGAHDMLPDVPWTYLFEVGSSRDVTPPKVVPRYHSVLVDLGAAQPWGTPLRLALGEILARRWIGDAIRLSASGHPRDLTWFDEGAALYLATTVLARLQLLTPKDWADTLTQQLSVPATSPYAGKDLATVVEHFVDDPAAHEALVMRGALFAARESAVIRKRSHGAHGFEAVLAALLARARGDKRGTMASLPLTAWPEAVTAEDPGGMQAFDAIVVHGAPVALPADSLGPCFRAGTGEYVAFDAGFDVEATRRAKDQTVVGLRLGGPAEKAGLLLYDQVDSIVATEGDARVPVKVTVVRDGQKRVVSFLPKGARARGQTWSRVAGIADDKCGAGP